jgi:tRNA A-37 threonylcarbamoyl transferase component Bud32
LEEVVEGYNFRVIARGGVFKSSFDGFNLIVPRRLLELDAVYGLLGDSIAGILLAPVVKASPRLSRLVDVYRSRVVAEESRWLKSVLGPIARVSIVRPEVYPLLRMRELLDLYCDIYVEALGNLGLEALSYARRISSWGATGSPVRVQLRLWGGRGCNLVEAPLLENPWVLVRIPEGTLSLDGLGYEELASPYVGDGVECSRVSLIHSIILCRGPRGVVAVKDYTASSLKWIPAFLASAPTSRFQRDPRGRAATELVYSRILRRAVRTPRMLSLNVSGGRVVAVKEYIAGRPVLDIRDPRAWREAGRALARVHNLGYVLGDANPSNFLISRDGVAIVDLEQARRATPRRIAWDIVTVIAYSQLMGVDVSLPEEMLRGYLEEASIPRDVLLRELLRPELLTPYIIMPFKVPEAIKAVTSTISPQPSTS